MEAVVNSVVFASITDVPSFVTNFNVVTVYSMKTMQEKGILQGRQKLMLKV